MEADWHRRRHRAPRRAPRRVHRRMRRRGRRTRTRSSARRSTSARPSSCRWCCSTSSACRKTKRTKTGYTTDADALQALFVKTEHPFLEHLLAHRDVTRLRQTVEGLQKTVAADGRIHTTYFQTIAATGRLSSADPNLQNIPIRTEEGRRIREAFVVGDGLRDAADRRLQPDRDAHHGAPVRGRGPHRGVPIRARTSTRSWRRRSSSASRPTSTAACGPGSRR